MSTLTAARPVDSLVGSLARAGWGDLGGREGQGLRSTLRALVDLLPHRSASGHLTAAQVADVAGLSERWVRRCMTVLEDAGLIVWTRGGVIAGAPAPSHVRIAKSLIVAMIGGARPVLDALRAERAKRTRARIEGLSYVMPGKRRRRSVHAELSASPRPLSGEEPSGRSAPPPTDDKPDAAVAARGAALARAALQTARRTR